MMLEDHVGDVLRKARESLAIPVESAARTAGLPVSDYRMIETAGRPLAQVDFAALGARLSLNGAKLAGIAAGWLPDPPDLNRWRRLRVIRTTLEDNTVNSFLVWDEATREAALFDTGWDDAPGQSWIAEEQLDLRHLFLTHHHEDHVAALDAWRRRYPDMLVHGNPPDAPPPRRSRPPDPIPLGRLQIAQRDTPGHSEDGATYVITGFPEGAPGVAVVGDALFAGSMGRGFFSTPMLHQNVREQILSLPPETLICPGHGPLTTVAQEIEHNPFF